jgi:hypothetical protein
VCFERRYLFARLCSRYSCHIPLRDISADAGAGGLSAAASDLPADDRNDLAANRRQVRPQLVHG